MFFSHFCLLASVGKKLACVRKIIGLPESIWAAALRPAPWLVPLWCCTYILIVQVYLCCLEVQEVLLDLFLLAVQ